MNIKEFFANKENPPELFWSLIIEPGWVQAGIWYIAGEEANLVSTSPAAAWETEEEMLGATDAALSSSIQKLPEEYKEPSKTVFGVPGSWVAGGEIKEEYLGKIKNICTELSLTPVGFVVISEAVAHLFKSEEGVPLNAVVVGLGNQFLEISIFKLGNLVGTTSVSRSVSLIEDVTEGLTRFEGASPIPSRIIIFDGKEGELEEARESLTGASWEESGKSGTMSVKFLHTPKVEVLTPERKVLATSLAGAAEIGNVNIITSKKDGGTAQETSLPGDIENIEAPKEEISPGELGFAVDEDVSLRQKVQEPLPIPQNPTLQEGAKRGGKVNDFMEKTKSLLHNFFSGKKVLVNTIILLTVFIGAIGVYWWFVPKANISIVVTTKKFEQEVDVAFSTTGESDIASRVVPGQEITVELSGDKTQATSGKKVVGDKAKGSVQIRNGTAFPINLAAGTFLVSSGNLRFGIDNSASVSAALSTTTPGTTPVTITADLIGAEYNLAKDEIFRIGNYPKVEVDAISTSDFSGGSSREISAVDKNDQESLGAALKDELIKNAKGKLGGEVSDDQIFVDDLVAADISSETFDHKIGDEAGNLKLSLSINARGVTADRAKFLELARSILKDKIPSGFVLRDSQIGYKFKFVDEKDGRLNYKVTLSANFLPEIKTDEIIKQISGKTPEVARNFLSGVSGFVRAEVKLKPNLPGPFGALPRVSKNISIEVVAEQ